MHHEKTEVPKKVKHTVDITGQELEKIVIDAVGTAGHYRVNGKDVIHPRGNVVFERKDIDGRTAATVSWEDVYK